MDPDSWQAVLVRAGWFVAQSQCEKALTEYENPSFLYPEVAYPKTRMAWILSTIVNEKDRGFTIFEEVLIDNPDNQGSVDTKNPTLF